jgi:hypothetical protein
MQFLMETPLSWKIGKCDIKKPDCINSLIITI